jgi:PHD/YefM family antitoxin component YafN of YafNO toxin-antitoxin module
MAEVKAMMRVSAAEFQRNIGRYQDLALSRPVAVTRNGREGTVLISEEEYRRLKRRDREVLGLDDFTAEDLNALERAEAPPAAAAFDRELKR